MKRKSAPARASVPYTLSALAMVLISVIVGTGVGFIGGYSFRESVDPNRVEKQVKALTSLSASQAVQLASKTSPIADYLKNSPEAKVEVEGYDGREGAWKLHVYTVSGTNRNTFGWYRVNAQTGEVVEYNL